MKHLHLLDLAVGRQHWKEPEVFQHTNSKTQLQLWPCGARK